MALINLRAINQIDTKQIDTLPITSTLYGGQPSRRLVVNSSGNAYAIIQIDSDDFIRIVKITDPDAAQTTYSGSGEHTAVAAGASQAHVSADIGPDDVIHILFYTNNGGTKRILHKRFDTATDTWVASENTVQTGVGHTTLHNNEHVSVFVDHNSVPHAIWYTLMTSAPSTGANWRIYYSTYTASAWVTPVIVKDGIAAGPPVYALRVHTDEADRTLLLSDSHTSNAWHAWELFWTERICSFPILRNFLALRN